MADPLALLLAYFVGSCLDAIHAFIVLAKQFFAYVYSNLNCYLKSSHEQPMFLAKYLGHTFLLM